MQRLSLVTGALSRGNVMEFGEGGSRKHVREIDVSGMRAKLAGVTSQTENPP